MGITRNTIKRVLPDSMLTILRKARTLIQAPAPVVPVGTALPTEPAAPAWATDYRSFWLKRVSSTEDNVNQKYWADTEAPNRKRLVELILAQLPASESSVLDYGSHVGTSLRLLLTARPSLRCHAVEPNYDAVQFLRSHLPGVNVLQAEDEAFIANADFPGGPIDVSFACATFYSMEPHRVRAVLQKLARISRAVVIADEMERADVNTAADSGRHTFQHPYREWLAEFGFTTTAIIPAPSPVRSLNGLIVATRSWIGLDRSQLLQTNIGAVEQIGCTLNAPGQWRPVIARRLNSHFDSTHEIVYRHPTMIQHPGDGTIQWATLMAPVRPFAGEHYAGAYFAGLPVPMTPTAPASAQIAGDLGVIAISEDQDRSPAMALRYYGPGGKQCYFCDFDRTLDGWNANGTGIGVANGELTTSGWWDDHNQEVGEPSCIGKTLSLLAFRYFEIKKFDGSFYRPDWTGARIQARIRMDGWSAPTGTDLILWAQARSPSVPYFYINWALTGISLTSCLDGGWHDIDVTLPSDPAQWTFAGGPAPTYGYLDLATTLKNIHDFIFIATRPIGSAVPTGTFRMDSIRITYQT